MDKKDFKQNENQRPPFGGLLGTPTRAKASGFAFSVASVLPSGLSIFFLIVLMAVGVKEGYEGKDWYIYLTFLMPQIAFILTGFAYFHYTKYSFKSAWQKQKCPWKYFVIALLLQVGLLSLSQVNGYFLTWLEKFGYQSQDVKLPSLDGFGLVGVLFVVCLLASVLEEFIFRGLLLDGLKSVFSLPVAILLCGAFFSLYHQNPAQTVYQFCCGVAFAWVAVKSGSILPTVLSHFINNAVIVFLMRFPVQISPVWTIVLTVASALCLLGSLVWLWLDKGNQPQEKEEKNTQDKKSFFLYASVGIAVCTLTWLGALLLGM